MKRTPLLRKKGLDRGGPLRKRSKNPKAVTRAALWKKLSDWVREAPCVVCGSEADHAHHVLTRGAYPGFKLCPANLVPLCARHHAYAHDVGWSFKVELDAKKPGLYEHLRALSRTGPWLRADLDEVEAIVALAVKRPWTEHWRDLKVAA